MRASTLLASLFLLLSLCGCVRTYRVEHSHYSDSRLHIDGTVSCQSHTEGAERCWRGPWPLPPACLRP